MKMIVKIIFSIFILYTISIVLLYFLQEKFIFRSQKLDTNYKYDFRIKFEEVNLKTKDNQTINALLFKTENPRGVILYFHGNKGSLKRWGNITQEFVKYGYDIFVPDYRGYGKSSGNFNEEMMYKDALLCFDYLKNRYSNFVVYGCSLGCTFATKVAAERSPGQLILEAPFCNLKSVVDYHFPLLTFDFLLKYKFKTDRFIDKVKCKTTIFHGTEDRVIPIESSKILYSKSNKSLTEYIQIERATHHNIDEFEIYKRKITSLLIPQ